MEERMTPKLRFKGFTDTWEQRKLGELSTSFEYGLNAAAKEYDGINKYIRITDIDDNSHDFIADDVTSPNIDISTAEDYLLSKGDILFARTGASVGKTYIYKESDGRVFYAGFLIRARIKKEFDANFVFQNTLTDRYKKYIAITSQRSGQPGVNAKEYSDFVIMIPSKKEQEQIGLVLTRIDDLLTLHQRKYEQLKTVKASFLQKMFPKDGESVPEIRFAGFTDTWEQRELGECFDERVEKMPNGELLSVTINEGIKRFCELDRHDNSNEDKSKYKKVCIGDIAYNSMRMWQGASGYSTYEGIVSPAYTVLSPKEGIDSSFFSFLFKRAETIHLFKLSSQGITSDNWNLKYPAFSKIKISMPKTIAEQETISSFFRQIDSLLTLHQRKCDQLKDIKKALLQKMFV